MENGSNVKATAGPGFTISSNAVAIITARGGSKRIPRKNIKSFLGKPIIYYSINAALESKYFEEVMVSTDDKEIAQVSTDSGAKVPFMRSAVTSTDYAATKDVLFEVLDNYRVQNRWFEYFCCIYPTAPFINSKTLKKAMDLLISSGADSVFPVTRFSHPIQRAYEIENGKLRMMWAENLPRRTQDLKPTYHDCGQFYCVKTSSFYEKQSILTENTLPLIVPESENQDIDSEEDWEIAEMKYRIIHKEYF